MCGDRQFCRPSVATGGQAAATSLSSSFIARRGRRTSDLAIADCGGWQGGELDWPPRLHRFRAAINILARRDQNRSVSDTFAREAVCAYAGDFIPIGLARSVDLHAGGAGAYSSCVVHAAIRLEAFPLSALQHDSERAAARHCRWRAASRTRFAEVQTRRFSRPNKTDGHPSDPAAGRRQMVTSLSFARLHQIADRRPQFLTMQHVFTPGVGQSGPSEFCAGFPPRRHGHQSPGLCVRLRFSMNGWIANPERRCDTTELSGFPTLVFPAWCRHPGTIVARRRTSAPTAACSRRCACQPMTFRTVAAAS